MSKQDDYVRITLRMPPELHDKLASKAGAKSLNAEIVSRLSAPEKTLRDEFAIAALAAWPVTDHGSSMIDLAVKCYGMADAFLAAREVQHD